MPLKFNKNLLSGNKCYFIEEYLCILHNLAKLFNLLTPEKEVTFLCFYVVHSAVAFEFLTIITEHLALFT